MSDTITVEVDGEDVYIEVADVIVVGGGAVITVTDDEELAPEQGGITVNNSGAEGTVTVDLPDSADVNVGWKMHARVTEEEMLRLQAQGDDVIRFDSIETGAAGYIQSDQLGACITMELQDDGVWFVTHVIGPWTDNS